MKPSATAKVVKRRLKFAGIRFDPTVAVGGYLTKKTIQFLFEMLLLKSEVNNQDKCQKVRH